MLYIGQVLYGYCGGYFGRDSYGNKRIEGVGIDWIVCRDSSGEVDFAYGDDIHTALKRYTQPEEGEP